MQWEYLKQKAHEWYRRSAQFLLFQNIVMYIFACMAAQRPVGFVRYIEFLDHCCKWYAK
jgi:hypothetical protein